MEFEESKNILSIKVFEKLVTLVGKIIWGSNEKDPNICKKIERDLSLLALRRLILKSPIRIRDFFLY